MGPALVPQLGPQFRTELGSKLGSDWGQTLSKMVIWDAIGFDFYLESTEKKRTRAERREKTERGRDRRGRE